MALSQTSAQDTILDRMAALGDPIRCRILLLIERQELSVSELCSTLQLPQSTVSRHLKVLSTDGWVEARKDGTSRYYSARQPVPASARSLWSLISKELTDSAVVEEDSRRVEGVMARRSSGSRAFFSSASDRWSEMRHELFGQRFDLQALLTLLDPELVVGDLGAGTGHVVLSLAPHVRRVIAVDDSPEMLDAASVRLAGVSNVELRHGKLESLPLDDGTLDVALLILVLHHLPEPRRVFSEAARVLKPGGRFLVVDMLPHEREEYRREMGHVWLGFDEAQIGDWFSSTGFGSYRFHPLSPEPETMGPTLFAATAAVRAKGSDFNPETTETISV
jgi:ArsR family transcriptional regulator